MSRIETVPTRDEIAKRIVESRRKRTRESFVKDHPTTTGIGIWRFKCDIKGWHEFTVLEAFASFGHRESEAWRNAGLGAAARANMKRRVA